MGVYNVRGLPFRLNAKMYRRPLAAAAFSISRRSISQTAVSTAASPAAKQTPPYNPQTHPNLRSTPNPVWASVLTTIQPPQFQPRSTSSTSNSNPWDLMTDVLNVTRSREYIPPAKHWEIASIMSEKQIASLQKPAGIYSGRSVEVVRHNVSQAFWAVNKILTQNNVRRELRRAERHEKPTDMRRRLKSERHRKRFADQVSNWSPTSMTCFNDTVFRRMCADHCMSGLIGGAEAQSGKGNKEARWLMPRSIWMPPRGSETHHETACKYLYPYSGQFILIHLDTLIPVVDGAAGLGLVQFTRRLPQNARR